MRGPGFPIEKFQSCRLTTLIPVRIITGSPSEREESERRALFLHRSRSYIGSHGGSVTGSSAKILLTSSLKCFRWTMAE